MNAPVPPFARTVCACATCIECCKQQPGMLIPGDVERIEAFLGEPAAKYLWASPGATAMSSDRRVFQIRTITPRMEKGRCVFLGPDDRCKIHPVAPFGCAYCDTHQSKMQGQHRSVWAHKLIIESEEYRAYRSKLPLATSHKPRSAL